MDPFKVAPRISQNQRKSNKVDPPGARASFFSFVGNTLHDGDRKHLRHHHGSRYWRCTVWF